MKTVKQRSIQNLYVYDLSMLDRLSEHADIIRQRLTTQLNDTQGWQWIPYYELPFDPDHESSINYDENGESPLERIKIIQIETQPAIIIRIRADKDDICGVVIQFTEQGGRLRATCGRGTSSKDKQANIENVVNHAIAFITDNLPIYYVEEEPCEYGDICEKQFDNPSSWTSWLLSWRPENVIASSRMHGL